MMGCKEQPEVFEFTIRGTIKNQETGQFYLSESPRLGDEIVIEFENYTFEYTGTSPYMYSSLIFPDYDLQSVFSFLIEPGEIVLELDLESLYENSQVISGDFNLAMHEKQKEFMSIFMARDFMADETRADIFDWMFENTDNFTPISYLSSWESFENFMPTDMLGDFLSQVTDKNLRNSKEFIELYSIWRAKKDNINATGEKAMDFRLPDSSGDLVSFSRASKGRLTYVEKSGSWCGNTTRDSRNLLPVYEKYKDQGLEIITVVPELKHDRWLNWLEEEEFPWINLVELDHDMAKSKLSYSNMIFKGGNYLVDENGIVIANKLSSETLNEKLMKHLDPEAYEKYLSEKWDMPGKIHILDREKPVGSFDEVLEVLSGKPFLIDCWATWCGPCFEEFKFNEPLKEFLATMNMEMVYISFDRPEDESKWLNTIREHNLQGYHFRFNDSFRDDFAALGFSGGLPTYMIVNENGEVVVNHAYRPSQKEKLYSQIESVLK